jgi:hypothetical protein
MDRNDYLRLSKLIDSERNLILFKQHGDLDYVSVDKGVLNNLSIKLNRNDLTKVVSIMSHYNNNDKGNVAHNYRLQDKIVLKKKIMLLRKKQKELK